MNRYLKKIEHFIFEILYPTPSLPADLPIYETLFCPVCKARQARNVKICHKFSQYKLGAATTYSDDTVRKLIWQLKYRGKTGNALLLSRLFNAYFKNLGIGFVDYFIIPMPLSQKRLRNRGYNQAELIARRIADQLNLPVISNALIRIKNTKPQMEIKDWDERRDNVGGCFGITDALLVENKNIILVDDVFTSGATMSEAVKTLKAAGAKRIIGLVVAKAS